MRHGKAEAEWWHTASILCLLANVHRDPKKSKPMTPAQFHPHHAEQSGEAGRTKFKLTRGNVRLLKALAGPTTPKRKRGNDGNGG